jgi:DNA-binding transcriptional LysR family regulator
MSRGTTDVLARANRHPKAMVSKKLLRRLDLMTLQLFVAVYEEGTLTRASRREAIAVSAASKRLLELEQALGAAVFVRQATGMSLTPAGETLLHHARRVLVDIERIGLDLADYAAGVRGHVRMVANLSAIVEYLPEDLREFQEAYDNIEFDLEERPSSGVVRAVADNIADLGICAGDIEMRGLQCAHYRHDRLVMVVRADHPLAGRSRDRLRRYARQRSRGPAFGEFHQRPHPQRRGAGRQASATAHSRPELRCGLPDGAGRHGGRHAAAQGL